MSEERERTSAFDIVLTEPPKEVEVKRIINLTPHPVILVFDDGSTYEVPASGRIARVETVQEVTGYITINEKQFPIMRQKYGEVKGLPEAQEGVLYVVSNVVAQALGGKRPDVVVPADFVRDEQGRIIGCKAFAVIR